MHSPLKLIVGLGNPGRDYEDTRHNAGFWFVDRLAREFGVSLRLDKAYQALTAKIVVQGQTVWLMQPQTYMNRSGVSVAGLATFYKIAPAEILVAHDELDFPPGVIKLKYGGSHAGHNGLKDIAARLGSLDFWRLRVGIGHPRSLNLQQDVADFVLHRASREQQALIDQALDKALLVQDKLLRGEFEQAMMSLHAA
ncbi:MAG: aminoacyl-tRNA hydrolase [Burkholderiales bacterium]|nr:aminoacyl-tRNA hydrolase [Burkholderiales bacterium]MCA3157825.1 aminoacyl-tRNA hydrolase [Burkholderiales bacterium]MCA3168523.1 aminoacyl-tRNA hydrolase [Burkholderiales bacterium]